MLVPFILYFINEEKSNTCGINFVGDLVDNFCNQEMKYARNVSSVSQTSLIYSDRGGLRKDL